MALGAFLHLGYEDGWLNSYGRSIDQEALATGIGMTLRESFFDGLGWPIANFGNSAPLHRQRKGAH